MFDPNNYNKNIHQHIESAQNVHDLLNIVRATGVSDTLLGRRIRFINDEDEQYETASVNEIAQKALKLRSKDRNHSPEEAEAFGHLAEEITKRHISATEVHKSMREKYWEAGEDSNWERFKGIVTSIGMRVYLCIAHLFTGVRQSTLDSLKALELEGKQTADGRVIARQILDHAMRDFEMNRKGGGDLDVIFLRSLSLHAQAYQKERGHSFPEPVVREIMRSIPWGDFWKKSPIPDRPYIVAKAFVGENFGNLTPSQAILDAYRALIEKIAGELRLDSPLDVNRLSMPQLRVLEEYCVERSKWPPPDDSINKFREEIIRGIAVFEAQSKY